MKVRFENEPGKYIEISSCKMREFGKVYNQAMMYLVAQSDEEVQGVVEEIVESWAPSLNPDDLTMEDVWQILIAKGGRAKREVLEGLPKIAAEMVLDFFTNESAKDTIKQVMKAAMEESLQATAPAPSSGGDDT